VAESVHNPECADAGCSSHGDDLFCEQCQRWVADEYAECPAHGQPQFYVTGREDNGEGKRWRVIYGPFADHATALRFIAGYPTLTQAQLLAGREPNLGGEWNR
jgi:hypothetical protein